MNAEQGQATDEEAIRALLAEPAAAIRARDASRFVTSLDPSSSCVPRCRSAASSARPTSPHWPSTS